jgi:hypothetical protein
VSHTGHPDSLGTPTVSAPRQSRRTDVEQALMR